MTNDQGKNADDTGGDPEELGHTEIPEESAASESELSMSAQVEKRDPDGSED